MKIFNICVEGLVTSKRHRNLEIYANNEKEARKKAIEIFKRDVSKSGKVGKCEITSFKEYIK